MILRSYDNDGNILPSIYNLVESIPKEFSYHIDYKKRPPNAIIFRSLDRIFYSFDTLINDIITFEDEFKVYEIERFKEYDVRSLQNNFLELLESINSFLEDCNHVFQVTTPYKSEFDNYKDSFIHKILNKYKHPTFNKFYSEIKDYRDEISRIINEYKHQHGRLNIICGCLDEEITICYYIDNIDFENEDVLNLIDFNRIKSFRIEINYHFFQLYKISDTFCKYFSASMYEFHKCNFEVQKHEVKIFNIEQLVGKLKKYEFLVIPNNELFTPKTFLELNEFELTIIYPLGLTNQNIDYVKALKIKDKPYPENRLIVIPTKEFVNLIDLISNKLKEGEERKEKFILENKEYFTLLFLKIIQNIDYSYIELEYKECLKLKTSTNIRLMYKFSNDRINNFKFKIFEINYLGIKLKFVNSKFELNIQKSN